LKLCLDALDDSIVNFAAAALLQGEGAPYEKGALLFMMPNALHDCMERSLPSMEDPPARDNLRFLPL
jgi:hypothetical protein